jgi:phenylpropionate dioxygenase-like ring-hydroxylating dioxygenase large terminal subunit
MPYLKGAWYLAAWAHEIVPGKILSRTLLGEPVALFRRADGSPAALLDRCPHRFAPLSAGVLSNDQLMCRYHGLKFDGHGRCVANPHGAVLQGLSVRSWPVRDAHRATWIWMGSPAQADPQLIPPLDYLGDAPETAFSSGQLLSGRGNYEIFSDNILDLSHTDYLHPNTLGGGAVTKTRQKVEETDSYIEVTWHAADTPPLPVMRSLVGNLPDRTDTVQKVRWYAPSVMRLISAVVESGRPIEEGYTNTNAHIMTPETETTTHYFFAATRNFLTEDGALNARLAQTREQIFLTEDKPMLELVQERMGNEDFWALAPRLLPVDEASVRVRRKLRKLIEAETRVP